MSARRVTPHFLVSEFDCFDGTPYPEKWIDPRLWPLAMALEAVRLYFDAPVTITPKGGYRPEDFNRSIGGARLSRHIRGEAGDFTVKGVSPARVHAICLELYDAGGLVIGGLGRYPNFTHVDVRDVVRKRAGGVYLDEVVPAPRLARWEGSRKDP